MIELSRVDRNLGMKQKNRWDFLPTGSNKKELHREDYFSMALLVFFCLVALSAFLGADLL